MTDGLALKKYASLKEKMIALEMEIEDLKPQVIEAVLQKGEPTKTGGATIESEFGIFTVQKRKSWTYTEKVEKMTAELKAEKAKEEILGKATSTESNTLVFKS